MLCNDTLLGILEGTALQLHGCIDCLYLRGSHLNSVIDEITSRLVHGYCRIHQFIASVNKHTHILHQIY